MMSITLHNIPAPMATQIKEVAKKEKVSLNKAIQLLLEKALAFSNHKRRDFSEFSGLWTQKELEEFEKAIADQERIDPEDWK